MNIKYKYIKEQCDNILNNSNIDFSYYLYQRLKENNYEKTEYPLVVGFKITDKCNFNCTNCYVQKGNNDLKLADFKDIFFKLKCKPLYVYLTGGDPFLNEDIFKIIDFLHEQNIKLRIHSTGIYDQKTRETIVDKLKEKKVSSIQLSIDSIKNFDGLRPSNFDNPLSILGDFIYKTQNFTDITVNFVLSKENRYDIFDVIDFCVVKNITQLNFSQYMGDIKNCVSDLDLDYYKEVIDYIYNKGIEINGYPFSHFSSIERLLGDIKNIDGLFCPACKTEIEIDMYGDVYPCPFLYNDEFKLGNIFSTDIMKVWKKKSILDRKVWSNSEKCKKCDIYEKCGGGCFAFAFTNGSTYDTRCNL